MGFENLTSHARAKNVRLLQGFYICACVEAIVDFKVLIFIGDHLQPNPRNPWKCHRNRVENVEVMAVTGILRFRMRRGYCKF